MTQINPHVAIDFRHNKYYLRILNGCGLEVESYEIPIYLFQALANWHNVLNNTKTTEELIADIQVLEAQKQVAESNLSRCQQSYTTLEQNLKGKIEVIREIENLVLARDLEYEFISVLPHLTYNTEDED